MSPGTNTRDGGHLDETVNAPVHRRTADIRFFLRFTVDKRDGILELDGGSGESNDALDRDFALAPRFFECDEVASVGSPDKYTELFTSMPVTTHFQRRIHAVRHCVG